MFKKNIKTIIETGIGNTVLNQRIIMDKANDSYTDAYVFAIYDQAILIRRLDGVESMCRITERGYTLLTSNGEPVIIEEKLKSLIDKRVEKSLYI